jgi:hypothetical protein
MLAVPTLAQVQYMLFTIYLICTYLLYALQTDTCGVRFFQLAFTIEPMEELQQETVLYNAIAHFPT